MCLWAMAIFSFVQKEEEKTKVCSLISCEWIMQFSSNLVCSLRWSPLQHSWDQSDKRSWSYKCVKITILLLLLIYSRSCMPHFLGPHDTLLCLDLISHIMTHYRVFISFHVSYQLFYAIQWSHYCIKSIIQCIIYINVSSWASWLIWKYIQ